MGHPKLSPGIAVGPCAPVFYFLSPCPSGHTEKLGKGVPPDLAHSPLLCSKRLPARGEWEELWAEPGGLQGDSLGLRAGCFNILRTSCLICHLFPPMSLILCSSNGRIQENSLGPKSQFVVYGRFLKAVVIEDSFLFTDTV